MPTIYVVGGAGPWYCDDDLIACDGIFASLIYVEGVAHVDGIGGVPDEGSIAKRHRRREGGLVHGSRHTGTVRGRDPR